MLAARLARFSSLASVRSQLKLQLCPQLSQLSFRTTVPGPQWQRWIFNTAIGRQGAGSAYGPRCLSIPSAAGQGRSLPASLGWYAGTRIQQRSVAMQPAASSSTGGPPPGDVQALVQKQDANVRRFVLFLVFAMLVAAAARVFPTMVQHNVRGTIAFLEAPDPDWQIQGVKSVQWVAADADKALELLAGGAAGHLVSMLSPRSPEGLRLEALKALQVIAEHPAGLEELVRAGLVDALEASPVIQQEGDCGIKARHLLSAAKIQERHTD